MNSNEDRININNFNVFELSELIAKGDDALIPALQYIFYKIMSRLDGRPTLIVLEEAWMAFQNPVFSKQLAEWLKTLRKLNAYIVIVTLQVAEILESPIKSTLTTQCATVIYTPNPDLNKQDVYDTYQKFGLNSRQIEIIKTAKMKCEYYMINLDGARLFNLNMAYFDIGRAFLSRTSKADMVKAKQIKAIHGNNFIKAWMEDCGVDYV